MRRFIVLETKRTAWRIFRATEQRLNSWRAVNLARKPQRIGHTQAASLPLSALTAWQALFEHGHLADVAGQSLLIHGGAGGVGSLALQPAHSRDLRVLATASARDVAFVRSLGADQVIDYRAGRFDEKARDADLVPDTIGGETLECSWRVLVTLVSPIPPGVAEQHGARGIFFIVNRNRGRLDQISTLVNDGRLKPTIADVFPLARALPHKAMHACGTGQDRCRSIFRTLRDERRIRSCLAPLPEFGDSYAPVYCPQS